MQVSSPSPALLDSSMTLHGAKSADPGRKPQKRQSSCQYGLWDLHQARRPGTSGPMIRGAVGCGPKVVASPAQATPEVLGEPGPAGTPKSGKVLANTGSGIYTTPTVGAGPPHRSVRC